MNKLLSFLLILSLIVTSSLVVYADDSETSGADPVVPESEVEVTEEDLRQIDSEIYSTAENLKAVLNASNSDVTYTTDDIYNLLKFYFDWDFWNHGSGVGQTWTSVTWQALSTCRERLTTINTSCNAIVTKITEIAGYNQSIASALGTDWSVSFRQAVDDIYQTLKISVTDQQGNIVTYSAAQILLLIEDRLSNIENYCNSIESMLATLNNTTQAILSVCNTISNTAVQIATNTANTITAVNNNTAAISKFNSDFNNIEWTEFDSYLGYTFNYSDSTYLNDVQSVNVNNHNTVYFHFRNPAIAGGQLIYIYLPVRTNSASTYDFVNSLSVVYNDNEIIPVYYYDYDYTRNFIRVFFLNSSFQYLSNRNIVIKVIFKSNYTLTGLSYPLNYIKSSNQDYYTVYGFLTQLKQNKISSKFELLYASDDLIAAKEEQQPYESQAIEDFTGSGSAAASTSDLGDLKSVSGTIKSGLATGGSVSNALAPFNANGGFWDWFKQDNYNDINNLSGTPNMLRSAPSQPEVIDFYSSNQLTLQGLLGGN